LADGHLKDTTHSFLVGFIALAVCVALSALMALLIPESKPIDLKAFNPAFWRRKTVAREYYSPSE
jgi:hypothetical protein